MGKLYRSAVPRVNITTGKDFLVVFNDGPNNQLDQGERRITISEFIASSGIIDDGINVGTSGTDVFKSKFGRLLQFHKLNASATSGLTIALDSPNDKIDFTAAPNLATLKATPIGADEILIADSADSNALKKATITSIVALAAGGSDMATSTLTIDANRFHTGGGFDWAITELGTSTDSQNKTTISEQGIIQTHKGSGGGNIGFRLKQTTVTILDIFNNGGAGAVSVHNSSGVREHYIQAFSGSHSFLCGRATQFLGVGNGLATPLAKLHVKGSGATAGTTAFLVENSSNTDALIILDDTSVGFNATPTGFAQITAVSSAMRDGISLTNSVSTGTSSNGMLLLNLSTHSTGAAVGLRTTVLNSTTSGDSIGIDVIINSVGPISRGITIDVGQGTIKYGLIVENNDNLSGFGTVTPTASVNIKGGAATTGKAFLVEDSANVDRLFIQDNGGTHIGYQTAAVADTSAALSITSTVGGLLIPRMTTTQRNAISTPATGLKVFDTSIGKEFFYDGDVWLVQGELIKLINREGSAVAEGDVLKVSVAVDEACELNVAATDIATVGVVFEGGANLAFISVAVNGTWNVKCVDAGTIGRNNLVIVSSTDGVANVTGSGGPGVFGITIEEVVSNTAEVLVKTILQTTERF